jgi:hypothetical protein
MPIDSFILGRNKELGVGGECKEDSKKEALWQKMVLDH